MRRFDPINDDMPGQEDDDEDEPWYYSITKTSHISI